MHIFTATGAIRAWASLLLVIVTFGVALGLTIGYVAHSRQRDDRRWCQLLSTFLAPLPAGPPATPQEVRGRAITEQIRQLYHQLGCG